MRKYYTSATIISDMKLQTDFIVIGSGIAGLNAALTLAAFGEVTIVTKKNIADSSTNRAQGGVAAVTNPKDTTTSHINDTLKAGVFHNKKSAVAFLVTHGKAAISQLASFGVDFAKNPDGNYATSFEAAHAFPRVHHATDITGHEIEKTLVKKVLHTKNITVLEHTYAVDLIVKNNICFGVQILQNKTVSSLFSRCVVLATGGVGQLYEYTTNPDVVTGDGISIAERAGVKLTDLEFVQFHPTALQENESPLFLLSEALRGEGAYLVNSKGNRFMHALHKDGELAPRDIVARAIFAKQKEGTVYLDIRYKGKDFLKKRFPNIYKTLKTKGFNLATDLIPVTPAEHFLCGGIRTDLYGKTSIKNLFAYGEVAATGVHGANRLASNSLLEGMVFSGQISKCLNSMPKKVKRTAIKLPTYKDKKQNNGTIKKYIQELMWQNVGIERSQKGLTFAIQELKKLSHEIRKEIKKGVNEQLLELQNMVQTGMLIAMSAKKRKKSLGAHFITN